MPRFIRHISNSALQFGINQVLGLLLFYLLSKGLDKDQFGELNWSLAVCLTAFNLLGLGLDQLTVRKIATGERPLEVFALFRTHVWWVGALFYGVVLGGVWLFPQFFAQHPFLLWIVLAKTFLFYSLPYKQLAAGREKFGVLLRMSIPSTILKTLAVFVCYLMNRWSPALLIAIFIGGDAVEWLVSMVLFRRVGAAPAAASPETPQAPAANAALPAAPAASFKTSLTQYALLLRESLPQMGVVVFSSAMARFDWIFIGLFSSAARLAEYSFAYKAFEAASLPLLIIAPLLVPFFTRLARRDGEMGARMKDLQWLLRAELVLGCGVAMLLNIGWTPVVDLITGGKYGAVNAGTIFILSLCLPILYLNNFLWTIHFARGRLRMICWIFAGSFAVNVAGDIWLIPLYGNQGAALAYVVSIAFQTLLYGWALRESPLMRAWVTLGLGSLCAAAAGYVSTRLTSALWLQWCCAAAIYALALVLTAQLKWTDYRYLKSKWS